MTKRILILLGHPDGGAERFGAALAAAYGDTAVSAGHQVRRINLADIDVPFLTSQAAFDSPPEPRFRAIQQDILWAEHFVLVFPLWMGATPAKLKALLEQVFRGSFALAQSPKGPTPQLKGRSARLIVTMGMPALIFRVIFGAHGLLALDKGALRLAGLAPIRKSIVGSVEAIGPSGRQRWLARIRRLGTLGI